MIHRSLAALVCILVITGCSSMAELQTFSPWSKPSGKLVLVDNGQSQSPIVLFAGAPPYTRAAAEELASYIEKTSGAKPEVIDGQPDPLPAHAIWVGYQPVLDTLFPELDFKFQHPEEILIAANANHLVIAGRDIWDPKALVVKYKRVTVEGRQLEYGTANAVYTFIQDGLGVRWLWPGELGEDVLTQKTIAVDPFVYRYHPQIRGRGGLIHYSGLPKGGYGRSEDWTLHQRLQLDSMDLDGGHGFGDWWERFHETHPDYFALQPDGTRSGFPSPRTVKLCQSNPEVWQQWLKDVEAQLKVDPSQTIFNASPNDGWASGHCVCEECRAWDDPNGELRTFRWAGMGQDYVALSDRHVTFANHCAKLLKERYPDKDYYVLMLSYGHSRPAPVKARPADNVIISSVANFFLRDGLADNGSPNGVTYKEQFDGWSKQKPHLMWRPNTGSPAGWQQGQLDVPITQSIADIKYVAERNCIGIYVDAVWEHWGTQGPLYYVTGQLTWDPSKDGQAILDDYYQRGFGPAASLVKSYWQLAEATRETYVKAGKPFWEIYDDAFFTKAYGLLDAAKTAVQNEPAVYAQRIAFFHDGLEWTQRVVELRQIMATMKEAGKLIPELDQKARVDWARMEEIANASCAINWGPVRSITPRMQGLHPDHLSFNSAKPGSKGTPAIEQGESDITYADAATEGWGMAFSDDFERQTIGDDWKIYSGEFAIEDGWLVGSGAIALSRAYPAGVPGYQRLEFEAMTAVEGMDLGTGAPGAVRVSDLSSFTQAKGNSEGLDILQSGYFFQFGGFWNKKSQLRKNGANIKVTTKPESLITPGKLHHIVVENDKGLVKFFVDEKLVIDLQESGSIIGDGFDRAGFYFHTKTKVKGMRLYVKTLADDLDQN